MDTGGERTAGASRAHRLGSRGARRVRRELVVLACCASIALSGGASGATRGAQDGRALYDRVLAACRNRNAEEAQAILLEVVDQLDASHGTLREYGPLARFAAELSLRVPSGEVDDPVVEKALHAIPDRDVRSYTICQLAYEHIASGRLEDAETVLRYGLTHAPGPLVAPRLWHARSETARLEGKWDLVEEYLDAMEASIQPPSTFEGDAESVQRLVAQDHEYRSRLLQSRAQVLLALGLLDRCRALVFEATAEAQASGDPGVLLAARLLAIDRALVGNAVGEALESARDGLADERLASGHALLRVADGIALVEMTREASFRGQDTDSPAQAARAALGAALAGEDLPLTERLKSELGLSDLELVLGRAGEAHEHLERARALRGELCFTGAPATEDVRLPLLAWRLARSSASTPEELARCREELFAAYGRILEQWQSTPRRRGGIGFLHLDWRSLIVSEIIDAELTAAPGLVGTARAFERILEAEAMGTLARERALGRVTLDDVRRELLGERRGMLVFVLARDRSHLFALDASSIAHTEIAADRNALLESAHAITSAWQRPAGEVDRALVRALGERLVPPEVRALLARWTGAITVGFDVLRDLPFGILEGEGGKPYGERLALCSLPSAVFGVDLARRRGPPPSGKDLVLVVANDPPRKLGLSPFRFEKPERERLLAPFRPESVVLLEKDGASRAALLEHVDLLGGARVLHFLAHGVPLPEVEFSSALVLAGRAPECFFTADDAASLALGGGLVILSACRTGLGPARRGDDQLVHLGGAFLEAGAGCVILSRFPVEDEATLALMEHFHARLAAGDPPAEALRAARAIVADEGGPESADTATFEVIGLGFEPIF